MNLTDREESVLQLLKTPIYKYRTHQEIADELGITRQAVSLIVKRLKKKEAL